ncbi:DUF6364 family protein [Oceanobacillus sp. FSL H7-0719]|uniref:DUF6364 family protein n=1 Tax=Oceanobacillus sp. FSL H7-0719 TaxID=2954507 RepID=UPI0032514457
MTNETKRFTLRMDEKVFEQIKEQAEKNKRSVAKEIEFVLEKHLDNNESSDN